MRRFQAKIVPLSKASLGSERPGHEYTSRKRGPDGKWQYEYAEPLRVKYQGPIEAHMSLREAEDAIRDARVEHALGIGADGSHVLCKTSGKRGEVTFGGEEITALRDATFTHNHPTGDCLSPDDVMFALTADLREIRACGSAGTYSVKRPTAGWVPAGRDADEPAIRGAVNEAYSAASRSVVEAAMAHIRANPSDRGGMKEILSGKNKAITEEFNKSFAALGWAIVYEPFAGAKESTAKGLRSGRLADGGRLHRPEEKSRFALAKKSLEADLAKAGGPFIGPRGGEWADAQHTISWSGHDAAGKPHRIEEIVDIHDTRERELRINARGEEYTVGVPGTGDLATCDRCGSDHEIHVKVRLSDGSHRTMGLGCAQKTDPDAAPRIKSLASVTKTIGKNAHELAEAQVARTRVAEAWARAEAAVAAMPVPTPVVKLAGEHNHEWAEPTWNVVVLGDHWERWAGPKEHWLGGMSLKEATDHAQQQWKNSQLHAAGKREGITYEDEAKARSVHDLEDRLRKLRQKRDKLLAGEAKKATAFHDLVKAGGPFIGPKGGLWADAAHTIPYHKPHPRRASMRDRGDLLADHAPQENDQWAALDKKLKRGTPGSGHEIALSKPELRHVLETGTYGLVSAGKNPKLEPDMSAEAQKARHELLRAKLKKSGLPFTEVLGHYEGSEDSFLVMAHDISRDELKALGKELNQDSVIFSDHGKHEMHFTAGDHAGEHHPGSGFEEKPDAEDYYTQFKHPDGSVTKFALNFDWDKFQKAIWNMVDLLKGEARGGKYIRRVATGNPKHPYRYYYRESAAARDATVGEVIQLGKQAVEVVSIDKDGTVTLKTARGLQRVAPDQWGKTIAAHYGKAYYAAAEKRATQTINAVLKHVPKHLLEDLTGTDEERLAELAVKVPAVHAKLQAAFARAGISPFRAKQVIADTLERRGWQPEARALVVGTVIARRDVGHRELITASENLAGGASKVTAAHVAAVRELRGSPQKPLSDTLETTAKKAEAEMAKLASALSRARDGGDAEKAQVLAQAMASSAMQHLRMLQTAYPGLKLDAAAEATEVLQQAPSVAPGGPKRAGAETSVYVAGDGGKPVALEATYKLMEADDVIASHDPHRGFRKREDYPADVQERAYHRDQAEQGKVIMNAQRLNPQFVVNTNPDAVNGPPILTDDGVVLGGNSRAMSLQLAYAQMPEKAADYRAYLEAHAHEAGFSPSDVRSMTSPVLVRVVAPEDKSKRNLQLLVRQMNESFTQAMDPRTMQVAMGRKLDDSTVAALASDMGEDETLPAFLASPKSERFVNALYRAGVLDSRNANQYMKRGTRTLNSDGQTMVARILVGRTVKNADVLSETGTQMIESVARSIPSMMQATAHGAGYDLSDDLGVAIDAFNDLQRRADAGVIPSLDPKMPESRFRGLYNYFEVLPGLGEPHPVTQNPRAQQLLEVLVRRRGPTQMANVFRDYARRAAANPEGQSSMFGDSQSPAAVLAETVRAAVGKPEALSASFRVLPMNALRKSGGPFIGPKGGKWADAAHTIPWGSSEHTESVVRGIEAKHGVSMHVGHGKHLVLSKIVVPKDKRGSGVGGKAMAELHDYADQHGKTVALTPSKDFGGSVTRLRQFYGKHGYTKNKGRKRNFEISEAMYREPAVKKGGALRFFVPLEKGIKGQQAATHKYIKRTPDGRGGWTYYYKNAQGQVVAQAKPMAGADHSALKPAVRRLRGMKQGAASKQQAAGPQQPQQKPQGHPTNRIAHEPKTSPPPPHPSTPPKPNSHAARVGLCGSCVAPPKPLPRLPNLTPEERAAESRFATAFESNPDAMADFYAQKLASGEIGDAPNIFNTDDAKLLSPDYNPLGKSEDEVKDARSTMNLAVHQAANAIAKKAFVKHLDKLTKLPEGDPKRTVLVTSGGVASGKGFALSNVEAASSIAKTVGAVWDAAGEQNATENEWVHNELEKRGLKGVFVFVDSDPKETWENPQRGVIERAGKKGRMVDARLFADSYAEGAKNFAEFHGKYRDKTNIMILSNRGKPQVLNEMPKEALALNADALYKHASAVLDAKTDVKPAVRRGGSIGRRVWGMP